MSATPVASTSPHDPDDPDDIVYPESDGKPMAESHIQGLVIRRLIAGFGRVFIHDPNVLVGGDFFWYPLKGQPKIAAAPDVTVLYGVPKDLKLRSYRPWVYGGQIALAVEVLSPSNTWPEMTRKRMFYERYGVPEYWVFDPETATLEIWVRHGDALQLVHDPASGFVSSVGGVHVSVVNDDLVVSGPDGRTWCEPSVEIQAALDAAEAANEAKTVSERAREAAARERDAAARERDDAARERDEAVRRTAELQRLLDIAQRRTLDDAE